MANITIPVPKAIALDISGELYYNTKDLYEFKPVFFRGCRNKKRLIIGRKGIPETEYKYVNFINKTKTWHVVDETSKKAQLMITKKWIDEFYFTESDTATRPITVATATPLLVDCGVDLDDEDEVVDVPSEPVKVQRIYEDEPPLLELTDDEKFRDCEGNILEIETRGERHEDKIFFKVADVSKAFGLDRLGDILNSKEGGYNQGLHYKRYKNTINCGADIIINDENTNAVVNVKRTYLYLTYTGLLRVLFVSRNKNATRFTSWAVKQLFVVHLGTVPNKIELASKLLHVSLNNCIAMHKKCSQKFPCIYLISLGKVGDLKSHFGISDETIADDAIIYKYGLTDDVKRRFAEHRRDYGKIPNCDLDLVVYNYIDKQNLYDAETEISKLCESYQAKLKVEKRSELVILNSKQLARVKDEYNLIGKTFSNTSIDLQNRNNDLDSENDRMKLQHQLEMQEQHIKLKDEFLIELKAKDKLIHEKDLQLNKVKDEFYKELKAKDEYIIRMKDDHYADLKNMIEMMRPRV